MAFLEIPQITKNKESHLNKLSFHWFHKETDCELDNCAAAWPFIYPGVASHCGSFVDAADYYLFETLP